MEDCTLHVICWIVTITGQKKKKKSKISFSLGGMISDKGHFGNLEQFDDVDKILPALQLKVAMVAS